MASADLGSTEWERSKISPQDINLLKKLGISKKQDALRFPSEESYPTPPMEYRVSFVDHLIRGLSAPIHNFLRGLLFVNPSKEIFSNWTKSTPKDLRIPRSFQHTREPPEEPGGPHVAGAAQALAAPPYCVAASSAFRLCLFAYKKLPDLNLRDGKATVRETFRSRRHREAKIWGTGVSVPHAAGTGKCPKFSIDTTAIFITLLSLEEE
ncbi:hypothetical protein QYE76_016184 [Lolium multiflorum]|uniref:Uncharacterized protein n=1 Tax=Lolium multiflorum TaxID=4521 RepID=A0AAD8U684_LOLMU|nr:hypothetical protein QYE76_016184 [Lolium multiflorum]